MKVIVAQTAASGAIYTRHILSLLIASPQVSQIALIRSNFAGQVAEHEGVELPTSVKVVEYDNGDMFAPVASGSARYSAMIVAPASAGTAGRIAAGVSDSLICRAADVMLKERRRLVLLLRESPLSLIHLRNLTTLTEAGAVVMPASPSFYNGESSIDDLALSLARRVVDMAGVECQRDEWSGKKML
ncbi:MAG: UbiX family flavin prenyltransferase [Rikenellaceae bacterium]